ncbi:FAD-binding dehydrogenase [Flaviflexus ciconiae]|uniref:FAD-binding dehydrogenase n=1 Tax=Flaviflexus ciconiae TaxID=2496867 RepID=A0A3Q9G5A1_9ACTO|nr:FAD-binding dehydrogenase [Flaviflexus ciconiae]AZQ75948.1 FAD-binding dehydrogenase [Flaviflexus ciconiae]
MNVVVIGAGLAGLVAASEAADRGRHVILVDQEGEQSLGGQAFWSFGGLFLVDSPEQRRMGIKDSFELARSDWQGSAQFDREEDKWGRAWADAYLDFSAGPKREWLSSKGVSFFPVVGWAERGDGRADGHGNSVPRFHIVWGTGPGIVAPFEESVREHAEAGRIEFRFRHQVDELIGTDGAVTGVRGTILEPTNVERGRSSSREAVGDFEIEADAVIVASGGIGGNLDLVRQNWPERLGTPPESMIIGVPDHVDGRMLGIAENAGGRVVNRDRMWHYTEGIKNYASIWLGHGIRILPGPSSLWLDGDGNRLPAPAYPGFDTLSTLRHLRATGHDHSWFILTQKILEKEFALSGSEQNPDLTNKDLKLLATRLKSGAPGPVEAFKTQGEDFLVADSIEDLVAAMNRLENGNLDPVKIRALVEARDRQLDNEFGKDAQLAAIRGARKSRGDKLIRVASPHKFLDPKNGPLVAVRLHILSRKTLGGLQTNLSSQVLGHDGNPVPGLYAAGEAAGFGGGGVHGYNSLEGTFLGGCLFSGKLAGESV